MLDDVVGWRSSSRIAMFEFWAVGKLSPLPALKGNLLRGNLKD
jgi:hypothetical protein